MRALRRAQGLKAVVTWVDPHEPTPPPERRLHDARLLAFHVLTVEKINRDPGLLEIVHRNFERWQDRERCAPGYAVRLWRAALRLPWPQIAALMTEQSERGQRLRSAAPIFGVLNARERRRLFDAFYLRPSSGSRCSPGAARRGGS